MPLVLALASMTVMLTLAGSLVITSSTEVTLAARYRDGVQTFYAAEGTLEEAIARMRGEADWGALVSPGSPAWQPLGPGLWVRDGGDDMLAVRAEARIGAGARRTLEATIARSGAGVRLVLWRELR